MVLYSQTKPPQPTRVNSLVTTLIQLNSKGGASGTNYIAIVFIAICVCMSTGAYVLLAQVFSPCNSYE